MGTDSLHTQADRLESWKEIAAYLKRDVTTVQRWERQEALPVRRLMHNRSGSVYALRAELDAWREERERRSESSAEVPSPASEERTLDSRTEGGAHPTPRSGWWSASRRHWALSLATLGVLTVLGSLIATVRPRTEAVERPPAAFDWLLVADVANDTGSASLAAAVRTEIDRQLAAAHLLPTAPPSRVDETLRLMRRPPGTALTEALAREIASRDPRIGGVIVPSLNRIDGEYVVQARVLRPDDGQSAGIATRRFGSAALLLDGASEFGRATAIEAARLPPVRRLRLERVTTSSLHALERYTDAVALGEDGHWGAAEQLSREALEDDPEFAAAHNWLGWSIDNQGDLGTHAPEALPSFQRAVDLAPSVSDPERYFFVGSLYTVTDRNELALSTYQALLRIQPDHFWAANNAAVAAKTLHHWAEATAYFEYASNVHPYRCGAALNAFRNSLFSGETLTTIERFRSRVAGLVGRKADGTPDWAACGEVFPEDVAALATFEAYEDLARGDVDGALSGARAMSVRIPALRGDERSEMATSIADLLFCLGRPTEAAELMERSAAPIAPFYRVLAAYEQGQITSVVHRLRALPVPTQGLVGAPLLLEARVGLTGDAEELLRRSLASGRHGPFFHGNVLFAKGAIAESHGKLTEARDALEQGLQELGGGVVASSALAAQSLAHVLIRQGDRNAAIRVLEEASQYRTAATLSGAADFWLLVRNDLSELYRLEGRNADASAVDRELATFLKHAEPDQLVKRRLDRALQH